MRRTLFSLLAIAFSTTTFAAPPDKGGSGGPVPYPSVANDSITAVAQSYQIHHLGIGTIAYGAAVTLSVDGSEAGPVPCRVELDLMDLGEGPETLGRHLGAVMAHPGNSMSEVFLFPNGIDLATFKGPRLRVDVLPGSAESCYFSVTSYGEF